MTDGRLDASILRQLLIALAMIGIMLARPRGLWPSPEHGKTAPTAAAGPDDAGERSPAQSRHATRHEPNDIVLKVARRLQALRRPAGAVRRRHHDRARPDLRPDRPQRRRQDHLLQRHHRPLHARLRQLRARRQALQAERGARGRQGRHRAHLPEHPPVRRDDGARERDGRPPRAHPLGPDRRGVPHRRASRPRKRRSPRARRSCSTTSASAGSPSTRRAR